MTNKELIEILQKDLDKYGERPVYNGNSHSNELDVDNDGEMCLLY